MLYLLLSILSSFAILFIFKYTQRFNIDVFLLIVLNYFIASALGFGINPTINWSNMGTETWFWFACFLGILYISMFLIMGNSTRLIGIAPTSVATKLSVVIPILFSIIYYNESLYIQKIAAMTLALTALFFTVWKKTSTTTQTPFWYLPFILFVGVGILDSIVKYNQAEYLTSNNTAIFTAISFSVAAITGVIISIVQKISFRQFVKPHVLFFGMLLGILNFGSMYFLIKALDSNILESSVLFAVNNVLIVVLAAIFAFIYFKEKISTLNLIGIACAVLAIALFSM